jgi:hypothetical protein
LTVYIDFDIYYEEMYTPTYRTPDGEDHYKKKYKDENRRWRILQYFLKEALKSAEMKEIAKKVSSGTEIPENDILEILNTKS